MKVLEFKEANINWESGQLVINMKVPNHSNHYRDIVIMIFGDGTIQVNAKKIEKVWAYDYYDIISQGYSKKLFELIPDKEYEEKKIPIYGLLQVFFGMKPKKFKTIRGLKNHKNGDFIECKVSNTPFEFKSNNYLIIT